MSAPAMPQLQRLYHFTATEFALDDITNSRLKIAQIDDLNDPFELRCIDTSGATVRHAYEAWRDECSKRFGVLCFSECWNDVLQWAHYADRHRGICLGFDVIGERQKFGKVNYVGEKESPPEHPDEAFVWRSLSTKLNKWQYEQEWRVFTKLDNPVWSECAGRNLYFADFGTELALKEVILGASSTTSAKDVLRCGYERCSCPACLPRRREF